MNELYLETSPYLLQHANNPVDWKAWNIRSLALAKETNKLIIISIGYSACHWCHVMEHESFENKTVAKVMNADFINIKVDKEERPDIDAVYMKAVQLITGRGGWPLNIIALPDGRPIWGGTYFRSNEWVSALEQIQEMYLSSPDKIIEYAEKLHQGINEVSIKKNNGLEIDNHTTHLENLIEKWESDFDWEFGGMLWTPKFMMPTNYSFLLHYAFEKQNEKLFHFINISLTRMANGGIFDTVDGGFSRYSTDNKWHIPHFEKMLYDNGQLVSLYSDAYKLTNNPLYKKVVEKTLGFVEKEWKNAFGGFFSSLDADSLNEENRLEEGAFYAWKKEELKQIIKDDFELFSQVFNINSFGLWEEDNYVLIQNESTKTIAKANNISITELETKIQHWEKLLYVAREKREKPRLDDKCLTSWNAIMLKGYTDAYKALDDEKYLLSALENARFIINNLWSNDGNLYHSYKNGTFHINGYLEDYCFTISAFISLYEITFDEEWLRNAKQLTDYCLDHFYDTEKTLFRFTSDLDEPLISVNFEIEDNVIPSSNAIMAKNLFQLSVYFNNPHYKKITEEMLELIFPTIHNPSAFSNWLIVWLLAYENHKTLTISSSNVASYQKKINSLYLPNLIIAGLNNENNSKIPFLKDLQLSENKDYFFVCENRTCKLPTHNFNEMLTDLIS